MKKILITGISCPLAQYTARALLERGYEVSGFSRNINNVILPNVKMYQCDLNQNDIIQDLAKDKDIIIHIAAFSSPWGRKKQFYAVNVEGTQNILNAALNGNCKRFIHISTPSIYFAFMDQLNISEEFCAHRPANTYVKSKLLAEGLVEEAEKKGLETITLRPRALFGPGDRVLAPRLLKALQNGGIPRFYDRDISVDVTYIENAAEAVVCAVEARSFCSGEKYNITNGEPIFLHTLFKCMLEELGLEYKERKIPYFMASKIAWFAEKVAYIKGKEPLFTPYIIGVLSYAQTLSIEKAKQDLNYYPQIKLMEGIKRYAKWIKQNPNI